MDGQPPRRSPRRANVLIVDDHEITRSGLRRILAGTKDLEVVGEAANGREAVALCCQLQPNLVLMDIRIPDLDGITATHVIKQQCPRTSVIMVTIYENPDYLYQALKAGAAGYLLKDASKRQVVATVRQVLWGDGLLHPELTVPLLRRLAVEATPAAEPLLEQLRPCERAVYAWWCKVRPITRSPSTFRSASARSRPGSSRSWPSWASPIGFKQPSGPSSSALLVIASE